MNGPNQEESFPAFEKLIAAAPDNVVKLSPDATATMSSLQIAMITAKGLARLAELVGRKELAS